MLKKIAYTILVLFSLSLFGSLVKYVHSGEDAGFITEPLKTFTSLTELLKPVTEEVTTWAPQFQKTPKEFQSINKLNEDVLVLYSQSVNSSKRQIVLKNLKTDSISYTWNIEYDFERNDRLFHPVMMKNKEVIFHIAGKGKVLLKIDSLGHVLYESTSKIIPHHSLNFDSEGSLYSPGKTVDNVKDVTSTQKFVLSKGNEVPFRDNYIVKWDASTGEILSQKSFVELLKENKLEHEIKKAHFNSGPFHSNDIQPVLKTTKYFQKGDLFISIRNMSMIVHYRPESNKIIKVISGPFSYQHDVDISTDSTITFFNNNTLNEQESSDKKLILGKKINKHEILNAQVLEYNYTTNSFKVIYEKQFKENKIFTHYEGLHHFFPNGDLLIEEQEKGVIWILNDTGVVYKNVIKSQHKGHHQMLNWTRVVG